MQGIVKNLLAYPEQAENPMPPVLPGELITPSKLNALRRNQLIHLGMAFGVPLDPSAAKSELLHSMTRAEAQGKFREKPVSQYYLLLASQDPDQKLPQHEYDRFQAALDAAYTAEFGKKKAS